MPLSTETLEFNLAAQLLIIRNPNLAVPQEASILHSNGWTEATAEDLPDEGMPLTPGSKEPNKLRKAQQGGGAGKDRHASEEGYDAKEGMSAAAVFGGNKRVYKPVRAEEV